MADLKIYISNVIKGRHEAFQGFVQKMSNRLIVGFYRYGKANKRQQYRRRIDGALKHYDETGNLEFLVDAANYCFLEVIAPGRPDAFFEASDSNGSRVDHTVFRKKIEPWSYQREGD